MREDAPLKLPIDEDYALWVLLSQVNEAMARARENELKRFGVSTMQAAVMYVVKAMNGTATPTEISRWVLREPNTVSQLLVRMQKQGLVKRTRRRGDKGLVRVSLTDKGEDLLGRQDRERLVIRRIMSSLSSAQTDALKTSLGILRESALEELVTKPPFPSPYDYVSPSGQQKPEDG